MNQTVTKTTTSKQKPQIVKTSDAPFSCPPRSVDATFLHPRIYLNLSKTGEAVCPYCSTKYVLER